MRFKISRTIAVALVALLVLTAAGVSAYVSGFRRAHVDTVRAELDLVADSKADRLSDWFHSRAGLAKVMEVGSRMADDTVALQAGDPDGFHVFKELGALYLSFGLDRVELHGTDGALLGSSPAYSEAPAREDRPQYEQFVQRCLASRTIVFTDVYREEGEERVRADWLVPLTTSAGSFAGVLALRVDLADEMLPIVSTPTVQSETGETLIVRLDGDQVVFLSELAFSPADPLELSRPADDAELPAAIAAGGQQGWRQGLDYRGEPVFASTRAVEGTPWFLVAKMDESEALAPVAETLRISVLVALGILVSVALAGAWVTSIQEAERVSRRQRLALAAANEELREANEAKSRFLASMSHELRTPLNSVIGFSGTMLQGMSGEINEEQERQLTMVNNSGKHLLLLINDVLDLSRIDAGAATIDITSVDIGELVSESVESVRPEATLKGLELHWAGCESACEIGTDGTKVRQIVLNLLSNAVKFTDSGTIRVNVDYSPERVFIRIEDTGIGIAPADTDAVFERFFQAGDEVERSTGTGLGLTVSRSLARLLGGDLTVLSEPGEGSVFTLEVPASRTESDPTD